MRRPKRTARIPDSSQTVHDTLLTYPCPKLPAVTNRSTRKIDDQLWTKVWALISDPDEFERAINAKISELKAKETVTNEDLDRIRSRLGELSVERQKVITWARKGQISDDDLEVQLSTLALEQVSLEQELEEKKVLVGNSSERLKELARLYREQINNGMELINGVPEDDEQRELQFQFRRRIIQQIVKRVEVNEDKTIKVYLQIDLQDPPSASTQPEPSKSGDEGTVDIFTPSA